MKVNENILVFSIVTYLIHCDTKDYLFCLRLPLISEDGLSQSETLKQNIIAMRALEILVTFVITFHVLLAIHLRFPQSKSLNDLHIVMHAVSFLLWFSIHQMLVITDPCDCNTHLAIYQRPVQLQKWNHTQSPSAEAKHQTTAPPSGVNIAYHEAKKWSV